MAEKMQQFYACLNSNLKDALSEELVGGTELENCLD